MCAAKRLSEVSSGDESIVSAIGEIVSGTELVSVGFGSANGVSTAGSSSWASIASELFSKSSKLAISKELADLSGFCTITNPRTTISKYDCFNAAQRPAFSVYGPLLLSIYPTWPSIQNRTE